MGGAQQRWWLSPIKLYFQALSPNKGATLAGRDHFSEPGLDLQK
jgi:hypothetical protein